MTDIGELVVRIKADSTQLQGELSRASGAVRENAREMSQSLDFVKDSLKELLPVISIGAFIEFGKSAIEAAAQMNDLGERIGFAGTTLSALNIPLKQNGSSVDELAASVNILNNMIGAASSGNEEAVKRFDKLGLSVRALKAMRPEDAFFAVTQALGGLKDQFELTDNGRALLGRGFSALAPTIKSTEGDLRGFVEQAQAAGNALTEDQLKRVHEFEDAWVETVEKLKLGMVDAIPVMQLYLDGFKGLLALNPVTLGSSLGGALGATIRDRGLPAGASFARPQTTDSIESGASAAAKINAALKARGLQGISVPNPASGSNSGLMAPSPIEQELAKLQQQQALLALPQPQRAGQQEVYNLENMAKEKSLSLSKQQIEMARELAEANFQAQNPDPVQKYIDKMQQERDALSTSNRELFVSNALMQARGEALKTAAAGTKAENALTDVQTAKIRDLAGSYYDLKKAQEDNERIAKQMRDAIADSLADIAVNFNSLKDTATSAIQAIAKEIIKAKITTPLASAFIGSPGSPGLLDGILSSFSSAHADGGTVNAGSAYLVGEDGPEIFRPSASGGIVPNSRSGGGQSVVVNQIFNMQPGLAETVGAAIRSSAPSIAAMAHASVFQAMRQGGSESRVAGLRG